MKQTQTKYALCALIIGVFLTSFAQAQNSGWGFNGNGQLGIGNTTDQPTPVTVTSVPDATGIGAGGSAVDGSHHTVFLKADGTLVASGANNRGQLGDGTLTSATSPTAVSTLTNVIQVKGGGFHSAALLSDGTVWSWGRNNNGQIGNGTTTTTGCQCINTPTQTTISDVVQIDTGLYHTVALKSDGTVWAWGRGAFGRLGDGFTANRSSPVQVGVGVIGFDNLVAVSAGELHSMALKSDGTVWIWGRNNNGQLGNGTATGMQVLPAQNATLSSIVQISAGALHNIVLRNDGVVFIWGNNFDGEVGNGTSGFNQVTPVVNTSLTNVININAGGYHNVVKMRDGTVWSWGFNFEGEVGNGTTTTTGCQCITTPVQTLVGANNAVIETGILHSFSLKPVISVSTGTNQKLFGKNVQLSSLNVTGAGNVNYTAIDPTTTGLTPPPGYVIQANQPAYDVSTTATTSGNSVVCLNVPNEPDPANFALLKILHEEGSNLVDRTFTSTYVLKRLCAEVSSFSSFVIARGLAPSAAAVTVSGKVTDGRNGLGNAVVSLTDSSGHIRTVRTSGFGYYRFDEIEVGRTYILSVKARRYQFVSQVVTVNEEIPNLNFTAQ